MAGIAELLPAAEGDADGPSSGTVFKIERGPAGEKIAYVRMFSGTVRTRDRLRFGRRRRGARSPRSRSSTRGAAAQRAIGRGGRDRQALGARRVRIGDAIGVPRRGRGRGTTSRRRRWRRSSSPASPDDRRALRVALGAARRAGPADQRPAGRRPAGALRLALRRGAEGGHPGDARRPTSASTSRSARRRRSASSGRPAPARRSRSCTRSRTRSSPTLGLRVEPGADRLRHRVPARRRPAHDAALPLQDARRLRRRHGRSTCATRCGRASSAGRSPTAS